MPSKPVNGPSIYEGSSAPRPGTRYSTLARLLTQEIEAGRYPVGDKIPTEAELQQRFDVSRHTVREALRDLKERGLVSARAGVGTVVRASAPRTRFMQGVGTLSELTQFVEATRMRVLKTRRLIADEALADRLALKPGQEWCEGTVLRFLPHEAVPVASMHIYVRPEHSDVLGHVDTANKPVFSLIEQHHGVQVAEVAQQIVAVSLDASQARVFKTRVGAPALLITRLFTDDHDRMLMASVGVYPSDRFSHNTKFRVLPPDQKETA